MGDFTHEDLVDAIDKSINALLDQAGVSEPPIDALALLQNQFGFRIDYDVPHDAPRYGDRPQRRSRPNQLILHPDASLEAQNMLAARSIAKKLIPTILTKLGIAPGTENPNASASLVGIITPRLLVPSRWYGADARRADWDLITLKDRYSTANWDTLAWRMLEVDDEPCVIAIVDDGIVSSRRGNRFSVTRALTAAEQACLTRVQENDEPARVRQDGWTANGWPTQGIPFRRIVLRATPDEL